MPNLPPGFKRKLIHLVAKYEELYSVSRQPCRLQRGSEDPSIQAAREQVFRAEAAERAADKALMVSKKAVKDAKDHVKNIEWEAAEEARRALMKQDQARSISQRAKPLGRHA